jgi:hypothetical protein
LALVFRHRKAVHNQGHFNLSHKLSMKWSLSSVSKSQGNSICIVIFSDWTQNYLQEVIERKQDWLNPLCLVRRKTARSVQLI